MDIKDIRIGYKISDFKYEYSVIGNRILEYYFKISFGNISCYYYSYGCNRNHILLNNNNHKIKVYHYSLFKYSIKPSELNFFEINNSIEYELITKLFYKFVYDYEKYII